MTKVVWVTGAGKGLGQQVSLQLAEAGWCVAATSRTAGDLQDLAADAQNLAGFVHPFPADIIDRDGMDVLVATIEDQIGPLDLAILNAGTYLRFGLEDFSAERFAHQAPRVEGEDDIVVALGAEFLGEQHAVAGRMLPVYGAPVHPRREFA